MDIDLSGGAAAAGGNDVDGDGDGDVASEVKEEKECPRKRWIKILFCFVFFFSLIRWIVIE